jgi:hypothetical protein
VVVGWLVGVCEGVGELLAVAVGLAVAWLDGGANVGLGVATADGVGVGEGVAVGVGAGWLRAAAATSTGSWDEAVAAIAIPATMATMPAMAPAVISRRIHGAEACCVPGSGPLPVNGCLSGAGLAGRHVPASGSGRHPPGKSIRAPRARPPAVMVRGSPLPPRRRP